MWVVIAWCPHFTEEDTELIRMRVCILFSQASSIWEISRDLE